MTENEQTKDFLCEFFGVSKDAYTNKFCLLSNEPEPAASRPQDKLPIEAFVDYANSSIPEKERTEQLFASLDCSDYIDITRKYHLVEWLKFAMTDAEGRIIAQNVISIAAKMGIKGDQALPFISSFLKIICQSKEDGNFVLPLRTVYGHAPIPLVLRSKKSTNLMDEPWDVFIALPVPFAAAGMPSSS